MKPTLSTFTNLICNKRIFLAIAGIWVLLQIIYVTLYADTALVSDPGLYVYYASECVKNGTMYPDYSNYHDYYIFNPGIVNLFILWITIFGNIKGIGYLFVTMNVAILYLIKKICDKVAPGHTALSFSAMYLFLIMPANFLITAHTFSEIPFEFCCMLSFFLTLRKNWRDTCLAGVCVALAYWIRPLGAAWMLAAIIYLTIATRSWKQPLAYIGAIAVVLGGIAILTHRNFPDYVCGSTTGGYNLIMCSHDNATGSYDGAVFNQGNPGYIEGSTDSTRIAPLRRWWDNPEDHFYRRTEIYTYAQYDSIFMARSKEWLLNHPIEYISKFPHKVWLTFCCNGVYHNYTYPPMERDMSFRFQFHRCLCIAFNITELIFIPMLLVYWIGFICIMSWRKLDYAYLAMPVVFATGITLITVTQARYNFIMLPWIYIGTSLTVITAAKKLRQKFNGHHESA